MRRGEFDGRLSAPICPSQRFSKVTIFWKCGSSQQTQNRLFESLVLLCLLDLVFSFGSILHYTIMLYGSSAERPA
jgi:hypothetical protein